MYNGWESTAAVWRETRSASVITCAEGSTILWPRSISATTHYIHKMCLFLLYLMHTLVSKFHVIFVVYFSCNTCVNTWIDFPCNTTVHSDVLKGNYVRSSALRSISVVPWLKKLPASLSLRRNGFDSRPAHVGFVVKNRTWNRVFSEYLWFPLSVSYDPFHRIH